MQCSAKHSVRPLKETDSRRQKGSVSVSRTAEGKSPNHKGLSNLTYPNRLGGCDKTLKVCSGVVWDIGEDSATTNFFVF